MGVRRAGLLAGVFAALALPGVAQATFPGANGKIAFMGGPGGQGTYTVEPDGSAEQLILPMTTQPSWSSTGARLVFFSDIDGTISTANPDGTGVQVVCFCLSTNAEGGFTWAPDGSKIVYSEASICGECNDTFDIWSVNLDGSGLTNLTNSPDDIEIWPEWSPDGTKVALSKNEHLATMNPDGTGLALLPGEPVGTTPSWSPDGSPLAYAVFDGNDYEIFVINADGIGRTQLTDNAALDASPAWSPDGTKIAFVSDRDGNPEIYVMSADGSTQTRLTTDPLNNSDLDWQPLPGPRREEFKNQAHFCKAQRDFLGDQAFRERYGDGANAYGKCVSAKGA
jgi:Tol biopolymer transport system component